MNHLTSPGRVFLLLLLAWRPSVTAADEQKVLVWELKPLGIDASTTAGMAQILAAEIDRLSGISLVPADPAVRAARERAELATCTGQPTCLAELGRLAGADLVVGGVVGMLGDVYSLDLKLVDAAKGLEIRRLAQTWSGESDKLVKAMRLMATRLLRPEAYKGMLAIETERPGIAVYVDGVRVATTPLDRPLQLTPGKHALRLAAPGYREVEKFIDIPFDQTVPLQVQLQSLQVHQEMKVRNESDLYHLGMRLGLVSNTGAMTAPMISLEAGLRLPFWSGRLALLLANEVWGNSLSRDVAAGDLGTRRMDVWLLAWAVELQVILRPLPRARFAPFLSLGPGLALVWQTLEIPGLPAQSFRDTVFGFHVGAGLEYRLGPGTLGLEARYLHLYLSAPPREGGVGSLIGGLALLAGYRLML